MADRCDEQRADSLGVHSNYAAVLEDAERPEAARRLIKFMRSARGQEITQEFSYEPIR